MMKPLGLTAFLLAVVLSVGACDSQPKEFVCSGKVTFGSDDPFSDQFVLRILDDSIEIRGKAGTLITFDGTVYKICLDSKNEVVFEFTACQSGTSKRAGHLDKVTGELTLQRFDMKQPLTGAYNCKPVHRVLE